MRGEVTRGSSRGSLWRHGDFMKLWSATSISQLGTQVTLLALPLAAILVLGATPFQLGLLSSLEFAPFLLLGLPAGVWVDRLRRRRILVAGDVLRAAALASVPITYWLDALSIGQLYVVALVTGVGTVFFDVAYQSYLPTLVHRDRLSEGNARLEVSRSGAQLAGPGIAGGLVQALGAPVAILADALSYVGSALFVVGIRAPEAVQRLGGRLEGRPGMRREIAQGLRYVLGHPLLRPIAACTSIANLFWSMAFALLVLFATRELGLSSGALGLALAMGNGGLLVGAAVAARVARRVGLGRTIVASALSFALGGILYPLATRATGMAILVVAGFLVGAGGVVYNVNQVSLRQAITPDGMLGRMNATMRFVVWGTLPIGALVGGALGGSIGLRPTLWVAGAGGLVAVLPPLLSPVRSLVRIPEAGSIPGARPAPDDQSGS